MKLKDEVTEKWRMCSQALVDTMIELSALFQTVLRKQGQVKLLNVKRAVNFEIGPETRR